MTFRTTLFSKFTFRTAPKKISLLFYLGMDDDGGPLTNLNVQLAPSDRRRIQSVKGRTRELGDYQVKFIEQGNAEHHFYTLAERYIRIWICYLFSKKKY